VTAPVTSPTFTIGHRYAAHPDVSHLDLYRFTGLSRAEWGDLEPYFEDAIVFVEWPEAGLEALPPVRAEVRLEHAGRELRRIAFAAQDATVLEGLGRVDPGLRHGD
jgi:tRNA threonylcarbamoyladenosine biosynthesis protein TsaE